MRTCMRTGCDGSAVATPELRWWAGGWPKGSHPPAVASLGLFVCATHRESTTVADLVTDEGWNAIVAATLRAGLARPSRASIELHWRPVS